MNGCERSHRQPHSGANSAHAPRAGRGFTLIELLVVITIIALLIAILLPALGYARAVARFTVCKANIRSVGQSMVAYEADHGSLPFIRLPNWRDVHVATGTDAKAGLKQPDKLAISSYLFLLVRESRVHTIDG